MTYAAFTAGSTVIYWDAVIALLGIIAGVLMTCALYTANGGRLGTVWVFALFASLFGLVCARTLYWYCHVEKFSGLLQALTDYSSGGFSLPGVLIGTVLAAGLLRVSGLIRSADLLLDCTAPGGMLALAVLRLSELYNSVCRGKLTVTSPALQHLPLAAVGTTASGATEYRFATFMIEAICFGICFVILLAAFAHRGGNSLSDRRGENAPAGCDGSVARLFLLLYCMVEMVLDSTRNDAGFFSFNAFISFVQIFCVVCVVGVMVYYSIRTVRAAGLRAVHPIAWILFLAALGCAVYMEYLVQRHGNWYLRCYTGMSLCAAAMVLSTLAVRRTALDG